MNSNQDNKSGVIYNKLLARLQQDFVAPPAHGQAQGQAQNTNTDDAAPTALSGDAQAADNWEMDELDPLDSEEWNFVHDGTDEPDPDYQTSTDGFNPPMSKSTTTDISFQPAAPGVNIPTVQNRFQAILKRRLQAEIECHPPRFPWETEIYQYEPDNSDDLADSWVPPFSLWTAHLQNFSLLGSLPETVLAHLLKACTEAVQSHLQMGAKMVRAVLPLFPDKPQSLNQLAGLVLLYPTRSPQEQQLFTDRYETATTDQKMALSLLAAREIFKALNLTVSSSQPSVEQQWQTRFGLVTLQVEYQAHSQVPKLRVQAQLPKGGSLRLQTGLYEATAERIYPGYLSVESFDLPPNQTYSVEIRFPFQEQAPLVFAIRLANDN